MSNTFSAWDYVFHMGDKPNTLSLGILVEGRKPFCGHIAYSVQNLPQGWTPYGRRGHLKLTSTKCLSLVRMSYPVNAECWTLFEAALMSQARILVEDIAKHQRSDPKSLWAKIRPVLKIPVIEVDVPEKTLCSRPVERENSRMIERCRAPCLLGFDECPTHLESQGQGQGQDQGMQIPTIDELVDHDGNTYFTDASVVRDASGAVKGWLEDDVVYLFEKK